LYRHSAYATVLSVILTLALAQVLRPVGVYAEQSNLPSPVYSAWWIGSTNVTQQWGCTIVPAEDAIIPANHSCTGSPPPGYSWHWHHGVDLDDNSTYPNGVGCTDGQYGPGTTIYAGGTGTVSKIATGQFQINPAGSNTYVNLVHEQTVLNDPSTGRPIALGAQITVGEAVVMTGNIAPAGGSSYGCHLHFEVAIGHTYLGWNGTGYDVDPTPYLQQGTGPAIAYGISMQLFATSGSMGGGAIWNDSYPVTGGFNGWGGFNSLGIPNPSVNFVGAPTGIVYNNQIEVFASGTNGTMWNYSYAPGSCGGNGWCAPWSMTGNGPLGASRSCPGATACSCLRSAATGQCVTTPTRRRSRHEHRSEDVPYGGLALNANWPKSLRPSCLLTALAKTSTATWKSWN
jgi:hypothetical protein